MARRRHRTQYAGIMYRLVDETKPNGPRRYIVGYTDAKGQYRTETLPVGSSLEDARNRKGQLQAKRRTHVPVKMTVAELLDFYLATRRDHLKEKTISDYEYGKAAVIDHLGQKKIRELTPDEVAGMILRFQAAGMKAATIRKILTPFNQSLKVALRAGWIQTNPLDLLLPHERPKGDGKKMRVLSSEEIGKLLHAAANPPKEQGSRYEADRWTLLFTTLIFTGLRIGEALSLHWEDVEEDKIAVHGTKTEAAEREVMLIPSLRNALVRYWLKTGRKPGLVFAKADGSAVARRDALSALRSAERWAGIPDYTLHELRHTFASILIARGEPVTLIAHQLGHVDPSVTLKTYAHLFDAQENVQLARERLQAAFGGMI